MMEANQNQRRIMSYKIWIDENKKIISVKEIKNAVSRQLELDDVNFFLRKGYKIG